MVNFEPEKPLNTNKPNPEDFGKWRILTGTEALMPALYPNSKYRIAWNPLLFPMTQT
jgi:hypothetical protein